MADIATLQIAESTAKADMLALLDRLRAEIEAGETVALFALPIHPSREFSTRSAGDIGLAPLIGYLAAAQLDAIKLMRLSRG